MKGRIFLSLLVVLSLFTACQQNKEAKQEEAQETPSESHTVLPAFAAGQVWKYQNREKEPNSTLTILKIETLGETEFIHISISGLEMTNPRAEGGISTAIGHLPYSRDKLLSSVTELVTTLDTPPALGKGYEQWQKAYNDGVAGAFAFEVKDAVAFVETTMNQ